MGLFQVDPQQILGRKRERDGASSSKLRAGGGGGIWSSSSSLSNLGGWGGKSSRFRGILPFLGSSDGSIPEVDESKF